MSNVKFGSPSPKVSVETSYHGIGKSHMVLQKSAMKELRRRLFFTKLRPTSTARRNRDARSTWSQLPTALVNLWSNTSAVRQMSNWMPVVRLCDGSRMKISWHLQRLGASKWKVLFWKVRTWRIEGRLYRFPVFGPLE